MSTVFSGGTYVNNGSLDGSSKNNLIYAGASSNNIQAALTAAGWSVVSGSGTNNLLMQTAQDPTTLNRGRVRFKDNGGSCVQVSIENVSGSKIGTNSTTAGGNLICGAGLTYRILASRYRFDIFQIGSVARGFAQAGILWIPAPYQGVITEAIYMTCNSENDTDTSVRASFRTDWSQGWNNFYTPNWCVILNGALLERFNDNFNSWSASPRLRIPANPNWTVNDQGTTQVNNLYRWHDLALDQSDPLIGFGITAMSDEALIRGQLYDWTILSDYFSLDATDSWTDGGTSHNFYCICSHNPASNSAVRGSIWVAYS